MIECLAVALVTCTPSYAALQAQHQPLTAELDKSIDMSSSLYTLHAQPSQADFVSTGSGKRWSNKRSLTVFNEALPENRSAAALGAVELPRGVLWWHNKEHSVYQHNVLHGQDFVLQRQRSGGPGLVLSQNLSSVQLVDKAERERVQLAMYMSADTETGVQLAASDMFTFDLTDYSLVEDTEPDSSGFPPTACTGIVLRGSDAHKKQEVREFA